MNIIQDFKKSKNSALNRKNKPYTKMILAIMAKNLGPIMSNIKKLEQLLKEDVLVEVNHTIKEMEEQLQKKKKKAIEDELNYMLQVKQYFDEVIEDIKLDNLTEAQAIDILEGLEEMKTENQEV